MRYSIERCRKDLQNGMKIKKSIQLVIQKLNNIFYSKSVEGIYEENNFNNHRSDKALEC